MSEYTPQYRIVEREHGFEPQMSFLVRGTERWFPLNREGYWVYPDGWDDDETTVRVIMPDRAMAERSLARAKAINGTNISVVPRLSSTATAK